jgi:putative spermidine/putrescine transport system ATP-binding protein
MATPAALELVAVTKRYDTTLAVDNVNLKIPAGTYCCLLGPSGCGKTSTLRMVAGHEAVSEGDIILGAQNVTDLEPAKRGTAMMFQSYALFPHLDVAANIGFGLRQEGMERRRREARVAEMLALVQMRGFERRRPHELSGGQKQRVALARALAKTPKLLLLDEPLAALDRKLREETRLELTGIQQRLGTTFLVVTHDQEEALGMASRIAVMNQGRLVQIGAPAEIYERPNSRFVADFVGAVNLFEAGAIPGLEQGRTLAVRPEKLRLSAERPNGFAVAAVVVSVGYQGGQSTVHLEMATGQKLRAHLPSDAARSVARGQAVWVSWAPEDAAVLKQ